MEMNDQMDHKEWAEMYKKLVFWELEIDKTENKSMHEVLEMQKVEANANFARFIEDEYEDWLNDPNGDRPILSHQLMKKKVFSTIK